MKILPVMIRIHSVLYRYKKKGKAEFNLQIFGGFFVGNNIFQVWILKKKQIWEYFFSWLLRDGLKSIRWFYCPWSELDSHSSNFVDHDPQTINADQHHWILREKERDIHQTKRKRERNVDMTWEEVQRDNQILCIASNWSTDELL